MDDALKVLNKKADGLVHIWRNKKMPDDALTSLIKNKQFFVIPTLLTGSKGYDAIMKRNPDAVHLTKQEMLAEVKRLYDAGVPILAGTDPPNFQINYGTDLHQELALFVEAGLPELEALKGATSSIARAFSLKNQGFIKEGYTANMVLIDGNPLQDIKTISKINTVWKAGKKVSR